MKKASAIVAVVLTATVLLGTVCFYLTKNIGSSPLYIQTLAALDTSENQTNPADAANDSLVNINTATADQLATLPGIGQTLAQRIIDYRNQHGFFHSTAGLLNVPGIGPKKLESILDFITTGGST